MHPLRAVYKPLCRAPVFRALAHVGRSLIEFYENRNYDMRTNGELRLLQRLAPFEPRVAFDVGANVGEWSGIALDVLPRARVLAFEPVPATCAELRRRLAAEPRLEAFQLGLSDRAERVPFNYYPAHAGQSSRYEFDVSERPQRVDVRLAPGADFCAEHGIERIDVLKIDVEGAELDVLRGFDGMLRAGRIDVVQFEYGRVNVRSRALLSDFYAFLGERDFAVGKVFPKWVEFRPYDPRHENFIGPNYLAVRRARRDLIDATGVVLDRAPRM